MGGTQFIPLWVVTVTAWGEVVSAGGRVESPEAGGQKTRTSGILKGWDKEKRKEKRADM